MLCIQEFRDIFFSALLFAKIRVKGEFRDSVRDSVITEISNVCMSMVKQCSCIVPHVWAYYMSFTKACFMIFPIYRREAGGPRLFKQPLALGHELIQIPVTHPINDQVLQCQNWTFPPATDQIMVCAKFTSPSHPKIF